MCSDHHTVVPGISATDRWGVRSQGKKPRVEHNSFGSQSLDLEKEAMVTPTSRHSPALDLSHYRLVDGMFAERNRPVSTKL